MQALNAAFGGQILPIGSLECLPGTIAGFSGAIRPIGGLRAWEFLNRASFHGEIVPEGGIAVTVGASPPQIRCSFHGKARPIGGISIG